MAVADKTALMLIDVQNDFLPPSGALPVRNGRNILPVLHHILNFDWKLIVATQDFHPPNHVSFASTHHQAPQFPPNIEPNAGIPLWADHCVQGTHGCEIESSIMNKLLRIKSRVHFLKKGQDSKTEQHSAFDPSGVLDRVLKSRGISHVVCVGLAADYCVYATAVSALGLGYGVSWLSEGTKAVGGALIQSEMETSLVVENPGHFQLVYMPDIQSWFQ